MGRTILAILLCVAISCSTLPVQAAATTEVEVIKYAASNYSTVANSTTLNYADMQANFTNVYSNGSVYMQGPTFDANDPWGTAGQNMGNYGEHNGTYISNLTDEVGGMNPGDEVEIHANDGFKRWFNYTNVYEPHERLENMVLTWWDSQYGYVTNWDDGMRLFFYAPPATYGVNDSLNWTNWDMHESLAPWYWHNYSSTWPSAKGLSVKYVDQIKIYPPHLHDFNTTGDTTGWAFRHQTSSNPPSTPNDPNTVFTTALKSNIADDDGTFQTDVTTSNNNYAAHRFNFSIDTSSAKDGPIADIEKLNVTWNGKGWHDSGGAANGTYLYIYNYTSTAYEQLDSNTTTGGEVYLTGEITSGISNYNSSTNNVTVLVKQTSPQTGDEDKYYSHIETDYVNMTVRHHHHN